MSIVAARITWATLAAPLALVSLVAALTTWPLVLNNSALRLALIAYVVALPLAPLFHRSNSLVPIFSWGLASIALQAVCMGVINFWF